VVVVSHTADVGGAEIALIRLLSARDREAFDVSAIVLEEGTFPQLLRAEGIPTQVIDSAGVVRVTRSEAASSVGALWRNGVGSLAIARTMRRMLRGARADLVVANSLKSAMIVWLAGYRSPWVWHLHDRLAVDYLPIPLALGMRALARVGPRLVVVNSRATARTLGSIPPRRVVVAYPGLPVEAFEGEPAHVESSPAVGIVGRISATKGQRVFLEAARRIVGSTPDARFRIIGAAMFEDAAEERDLHALVAASPELEACVDWTGWVGDTGAELRRLTLAVHASPVPEPFGQVIVEAMAAGVPVIGTDAGGVPEIIDPDASATVLADGVRRSELGLLVRAGDDAALARAIEWMLQHPSDAAAMAAAARESARERYGIGRTWAVVATAWTAALTGGRRG
jgi:glycosyltransferase involved in cell wall biosynthesis